jgi:hypothetical protein
MPIRIRCPWDECAAPLGYVGYPATTGDLHGVPKLTELRGRTNDMCLNSRLNTPTLPFVGSSGGT